MTQTVEEQTASAWGDYGAAGAWAPVLDELKRVDTWLVASLRVNDAIMDRMRICQWPGMCADDDYEYCDSAAVARVITRDLNVDPADPEACEFPGDVHPEIGCRLVCDFHLSLASKPVDDAAAHVEIVAVEQLS